MNSLLLASSATSSIVMLIVIGVMLIFMFIFPTIGQKKKMEAYKDMQSKLKAGDLIQTVGGVIGRIVKLSEKEGIKTIVIETGDKANKTTMEFNIDAIAGVMTKEDSAVANATTPSVVDSTGIEANTEKTQEESTSSDDEIENLIEKSMSTTEEKSNGTKEKKKKKNK